MSVLSKIIYKLCTFTKNTLCFWFFFFFGLFLLNAGRQVDAKIHLEKKYICKKTMKKNIQETMKKKSHEGALGLIDFKHTTKPL